MRAFIAMRCEACRQYELAKNDRFSFDGIELVLEITSGTTRDRHQPRHAQRRQQWGLVSKCRSRVPPHPPQDDVRLAHIAFARISLNGTPLSGPFLCAEFRAGRPS